MKLKNQRAFTLIELIIVLLIIGILSGVALRAIEMTRERTMYTDTTKKINEIAKAITGNPDLLTDGKRVDYGFIGDMGRLPITLTELIRNTENSPNWHGPYIKIAMLEDTLNPTYQIDAWGNQLQYNNQTGAIASRANQRQTLTYNLTDSLTFIFNNRISGIITDNNNNPPGSKATQIDIKLQLPDRTTQTQPKTSGAYRIDTVPIGKHQLTIIRHTAITETLTKWVSVIPKSNTIVDFRLATAFQASLKYVSGTAIPYQQYGYDTVPSNIRFDIYNEAGETIKINSMRFSRITPFPFDTVYCETIYAINPITHTPTRLFGYSSPYRRPGEGDAVDFFPDIAISPAATLSFTLLHFWDNETSYASPYHQVNMDSSDFQIIFSDGSIISFLAREPIP